MRVLAPVQTETDEIPPSLRQMALTLPAAITAGAINPISHLTFFSRSVDACCLESSVLFTEVTASEIVGQTQPKSQTT